MFNLGLVEFLLIFFFVVLFVKPEDIPKVSKNAGLLYRKVCRYFYNLKYELSELSEIEDKSSLTKKVIKKRFDEVPKSPKRIKK